MSDKADTANPNPEKPAKKDYSDRLETAVGGGGSTRGEFSRDGTNTSVATNEDPGQGIDFGSDGSTSRTGLDKSFSPEEGSGEDELEVTSDEEGSEEGAAEEEGTEGDEEAAELPEWNPEDPDTVEAYEAKYLTEDGSELNFQTLSEEFWKSYDPEKQDGGLNEATYGFLKDRFGISKDAIKKIEQGQVALRSKADAEFYSVVGGETKYEEMRVWAKDGLTQEQKERFNAALTKGGEEAVEALELLAVRYSKANPGAASAATDKPTKKTVPGIQRRPASPQKDATASAGNPQKRGVQPYTNAEEHRKAQSAAMKSGDPKQLEEVRSRLKVSKFWKP